MKAQELRGLSVEELQARLEDNLKDQFTYRMQKATSQLGQTHLLKQARRDVARIKTVLTEKAGVES